jgi:hypothetical protein
MKREVFKVQKPLAGEDVWLVYNKGKTIIAYIPGNEIGKDVRALMRSDYKMYVMGSISKQGKFSIVDRVSARSW